VLPEDALSGLGAVAGVARGFIRGSFTIFDENGLLGRRLRVTYPSPGERGVGERDHLDTSGCVRKGRNV